MEITIRSDYFKDNESSPFSKTFSKKISRKDRRETSSLRKALPQIIVVSVKNVLMLAFGMSLGYPTVLIPSLSGGNPAETIALDREALSWIGSVNLLCAPLGCLLSGIVTQLLGRRRAMQLVSLPFLTAWLLFYCATEPWHIFFALSSTGFGGGLLEAPTTTYLAEVTTPNLRGILVSTTSVAVVCGVLVEFLLGSFLHWRSVALVNAILPVLFCLLIFFVPESPYWLMANDRSEDAQRSMAWLRGWLETDEIEREFREFREQLAKNHSNGCSKGAEQSRIKSAAKLYTQKRFFWPFGLVILTFGLGHFSGMTVLQTYAVTIFATFRVPIDEFYATVILGVAEALGCVLSSTLVHLVGKRRMNFFSLIGTGVCFGIVATYAQVMDIAGLATRNDGSQLSNANWLPMVFLVGAAFFAHAGIRILPWMLVGEVFHSQIRATATGLSAASSYALGFVANKIFFSTIGVFTLPGTFWFYSCVCLLGFVLIYFLLPETEGKTLFQITEHFEGGNKLGKTLTNYTFNRRPTGEEEDEEEESEALTNKCSDC